MSCQLEVYGMYRHNVELIGACHVSLRLLTGCTGTCRQHVSLLTFVPYPALFPVAGPSPPAPTQSFAQSAMHIDDAFCRPCLCARSNISFRISTYTAVAFVMSMTTPVMTYNLPCQHLHSSCICDEHDRAIHELQPAVPVSLHTLISNKVILCCEQPPAHQVGTSGGSGWGNQVRCLIHPHGCVAVYSM